MGLFSSESKSQTQVDPMRRDQVIALSDQLFGLSQQPFEMFPDQMYAGQDPLQAEALGMQEAYARGLGGMVDPAMQAWGSMLSAPDVANNPYVQGMLDQQQRLAGRNLAENIMPAIQSGAIGAGQLGSSRQGVAEGIAARGTQEALLNQAAQTQMDAYRMGLGQQQFGLGATGQMMGLGQMPAQILSGVGAERRAEDQLALDEEMRRFQFEQDEPWMRMERLVPTYNALTGQYTTTTNTQQTTPSAFQVGSQLAGLGLAGYGLGAFGGGGGAAPGFTAGFGPQGYNFALGGGYGTVPGSQQSQMLANQMRFN